MPHTAGPTPGSSTGSHLEAHIPILLTAAHSMHAVSAHMLSTAVPPVAAPIALDTVSLRTAAHLNTSSINLATALDAGSWILAGGATEIQNAAHAFMATEIQNADSFSGTTTAGGVPTVQPPTFPPPPTTPDLPMPEVPAPSGAIDAEYISMLANSGTGDGPHTAAAQFWTTTGHSLTQISDVLAVARDALRNGWQSPDAEPAHAALQRFHAWIDDTSKSATQLGHDWHTHIQGWQRFKQNIPTTQDARQVKANLLQSMADNAANGGLSTPEVVHWGNQYADQNTTAQTELNAYDGTQSTMSPRPDPGDPPPIASTGPPRTDGAAKPPPGTLQDRLTDDPALKGLNDPKAIMTAMMAAAAGAAGGFGALTQAGKGIFQPIGALPQQLAQQVSQIGQMAKAASPNATNLARKTPSPASAKKAGGGGGAGKGGGGGTKPAGLGGGPKLTPPPTAVPATPATLAIRGVAPPATNIPRGGAPMGMMPPIGALAAGQGGNQKDKARNKDLFPDSPEFDDDQEHAPAVLGAKPEPTKPKPTYDRKLSTAPLKRD